jgi:ribonucleotide monophosphatase NagD (HAD superfamily)
MQSIKNFITDMDGVLIAGEQVIPGADRLITQLQELGREYLVLTGVIRRQEIERFPYLPAWVLESVAEIEL